ncbi:unnamed protein product [Polarella glacialis]|uniref:Nucleotide-diphospho-sugar transferase domain-containing protein n=1 Tax=Polarella glacialis TaxID=89957 RepID=A0A813EP65_POLGL|nr:unnamed protein product [Polarella glacialis]
MGGRVSMPRASTRAARPCSLGIPGRACFAALLTAHVASPGARGQTAPSPLNLEAFEDADCLGDPRSELLLELMSEFADVLEDALSHGETASLSSSSSSSAPSPHEATLSARSWATAGSWISERGPIMMHLSGTVLSRPYCEPGKVAGAAATCLLLLDRPEDENRMNQAFQCTKDLEGMLEATAPGTKSLYDTRLHMFLRSPWPAFRLVELLVRLFPGSDRLDPDSSGPVSLSLREPEFWRCVKHEDLHGAPLEFDWPWFHDALKIALDSAMDSHKLELWPEDGPLSEQYRARWARVYRSPMFRDTAAFASAAFYKFRRQQWEAGCSPGIVAAYLMQVVTFCSRDTEAWLHRYVGASWRLQNLLTPVSSLVNHGWPIFQILHLGGLLRRHPAPWHAGQMADDEGNPVLSSPPPAAGEKQSPAEVFQHDLRSTLERQAVPQEVYVTAVWGSLTRHLGVYLARWASLKLPSLWVLAMDAEAVAACKASATQGVSCFELSQRLGIEVSVAKYLAMAVAVQFGAMAVWLDLDVYLPRDPTASLQAALGEGDGSLSLVLAGSLTSKSLSPSVIAARGSEACALFLRYAAWLYEHPYILDHQGWDAILRHRDGEFSGSWDYKGRNISGSPDDGLHLSFAPPAAEVAGSGGQGRADTEPAVPPYGVLGPTWASGDGWLGPGSPEELEGFHFWGTIEKPAELFEAFYPFEGEGFSASARAVISQYRRLPISLDADSVAARAPEGPGMHLTAVSYASGCCEQALERNRQTALDSGADQAKAFGPEDLDPAWAARHSEVLSQRKGGGWWLWKPHVILKMLRDDSVPWHTGVVLWLDAGNFFVGDTKLVAEKALRNSDVAAISLKCCLESDWSSAQALQLLGGEGYAIADRPQLGAYFLVFRKTTTALTFVEDWLRLCENPDILIEPQGDSDFGAAAAYQRHMADQSVFSVLFKQRGFKAMTLEEAHQVVQLDRWRQ